MSAAPTSQIPGYYHRKIGDITVTCDFRRLSGRGRGRPPQY